MKREEMYESVGFTDRDSGKGMRTQQVIWRLGNLRAIIKENPEDYLDEEHSMYPHDYDEALEEAQEALENTLSPVRQTLARTDFRENLKMAHVHLMILMEDIKYPLEEERQKMLEAAYMLIGHLSSLEMKDDMEKIMSEMEEK